MLAIGLPRLRTSRSVLQDLSRAVSRLSRGPVEVDHRQDFFDPTGSNTITIVHRTEKDGRRETALDRPWRKLRLILRPGRPISNIFGAKLIRTYRKAFFQHTANPTAEELALCSRIGGWKRAISDRSPNREFYAVKKVPFRSQLFRSSNPIRASRRKVDFFKGMRGSDYSIEKLFEVDRISNHSRKHTITPCNSSDAWFTAAAAAHSESAWHILFFGRQHVLWPPAARAVIRWQPCVLSMTFLQHHCSCCARFATLDEIQRHNRDDEADGGSPRDRRTLCSRKRRDEDVLEHSKQLNADRPPKTREQDTKQFSTDYRLPYARVSTHSRSATLQGFELTRIV